MSFCFDTKQEICCTEEKNKLIMFYGMLLSADRISFDRLQIISENVFVVNLLNDLSGDLFGVNFWVEESVNAYIATLSGDDLIKVLTEFHIDHRAPQMHFDPEIIDNADKLSAFLKGAFLISGSVSNPYSAYHLELILHGYQLSKEIAAFLFASDFPFKTVMRKSHHVLYVKNSSVIERFLYVLGAKKAAFDLVNAKIYKQIQNDNNRLNNCEGYNRDKTMNKSIEQILAIQKIKESKGMDFLSDDLREVALLRLDNQYASLAELSALLNGKYSKAGLSRRLNKIVELSNKLEGTIND